METVETCHSFVFKLHKDAYCNATSIIDTEMMCSQMEGVESIGVSRMPLYMEAWTAIILNLALYTRIQCFSLGADDICIFDNSKISLIITFMVTNSVHGATQLSSTVLKDSGIYPSLL